ncbi:MAG: NAD+ diphosphatase [Phenylobacterium sp.]|jgi:NAD+ diphosphatase
MMTANLPEPLFCQNSLNRMDHLRGDILIRRLANLSCESDRYLLLAKGQILLKPQGLAGQDSQRCFFSAAELSTCEVSEELLKNALCVFLGVKDGLNYYTLAVSESMSQVISEGESGGVSGGMGETVNIRSFVLAGGLPDSDLGILAEANSLLSWHATHGYCARCGSKSEVVHGGWRRDCPACQTEHFPRTDPVVIMLVTYGNQCLLGRGHQFDERRFSCLAGFMEPGETFAQAGRRELWEEAGVIGGEVTYMCDQPWPFPSNLMIGVHIEAKDQQLTIDYNELAEVIWVSKADVVAVLNGDTDKTFLLPPRIAIARTLLELWIKD